MYENITYEKILERMLDRIPENMDKREGSIIYDAIAPAAVELRQMYIELDVILKETFGDTASREYLIRRAKERGLYPYPATKAILKASYTPIDIEVSTGSRFSSNNENVLNYSNLEKIGTGQLKIECETAGKIGNRYLGDLIPIEYINGLETIKITEVLIPGDDEEDTEDLRKRYFDSFNSKAYGGNIEDYLKKTNSIPGVGVTKVTPVWNGGGTVKLTILDDEYNKASSELIKKVQDIIDPSMDAKGLGIAPIGHIVTVDTANVIEVNISTNITFDKETNFEKVKETIKSEVEKYLIDIRKSWASQNNSVVRIAQIENRIMNITGVIDISNTTINGNNRNLILSEYEIPTMGEITND